MSKKNRRATALTAQRPRDDFPPGRVETVLPKPAEKAAAAPAWKLTPVSALKALASLKLTVVLMLMSMVLVLAGTLAQIDQGVWQVVDKYFWSSFVWIPLQIFFPRSMQIPTWGGFPFLGGKLLGFLLLINLLAAHATRFKITWKRSGIWMIHGGLIL